MQRLRGVSAALLSWLAVLIASTPAGAGTPVPTAPAATHTFTTSLIELPAPNPHNDVLAVILSGDGGWADLDRDFGNAFQKQGVATLGVDCLKYFWKVRQPDEVSRDLEIALRDYLKAWHKRRLLLVGFSFGANWLPFLVNRLPDDLRQRVILITLLAPGKFANIEVKFDDWFREVHRPGALDVTREATHIRLPLLCVYGAEQQDDALCPMLRGSNVRILRKPGGHHFNHDYATIEAAILKYLVP